MQLLQTVAAHAIPFVPRALIQSMSRRYIAGDCLADAIARTAQLNAQGYPVTLDVLGESTTTWEQVERTNQEYGQLLSAIQTHGLDAGISVKPTAIGLQLHQPRCEQLLDGLLASARHANTSVCMDMEDITCTQAEIDLFQRLRTCHGNIHLALQAYLQRTDADIAALAQAGNSLRICKGIYREERTHLVDGAWHDRSTINPHFLRHIARCFEAKTFVAIATHDAVLIQEAIALAQRLGVDKSMFEFQMLLGVCEPLRNTLRDAGFCVRIYVPYGQDWYGYSTRRLKENPHMVGLLLKSMLKEKAPKFAQCA